MNRTTNELAAARRRIAQKMKRTRIALEKLRDAQEGLTEAPLFVSVRAMRAA